MRVIVRIIIGVILGAIVAEAYFALLLSATPSVDKLERELRRNYRHIAIVRDYLVEQEVDQGSLWIHDVRDIRIQRAFHWSSPVEDEALLRSLRTLHWRGFRYIHIGYDSIVFERWHLFSHDGWQSRGLVYSIDGRSPEESHVVFLLTESYPLPKERWFAYISDEAEFFRRWDEFLSDISWIGEEFVHSFDSLIVIKDFMAARRERQLLVNDRHLKNAEMQRFDLNISIPIDDKEVSESFYVLFGHGYTHVRKSDNIIYFFRHCYLRNISYGILYIIDESRAANNHLSMIIEPSSVLGWYFYVVDRYAWRIVEWDE